MRPRIAIRLYVFEGWRLICFAICKYKKPAPQTIYTDFHMTYERPITQYADIIAEYIKMHTSM